MNARRQKNAFTLVEVLIVVVIMAVLAATIIPQFSDSAKDAKVSTVKYNLSTFRSQIQYYRSQHDGKVPSIAMTELTSKTNGDGSISATGAYGKYFDTLPMNPFTSSNSIKAATAATKAAQVDTAAGWLYDAATGEIWINHADYVNE